jgi:hypothetical protein
MALPEKDSTSPGTDGGTQNASDNRGNATGGGDDFRKQLEAERTARLKAEKQYGELRTLNSRQAAELGQLRQQTQPENGYNGYADPNEFVEQPLRRSDGRFKKQRDEGGAFQSALDGFQLDLLRGAKKFPNGAWEPYYDRVIEFIKDPAQAESVAAFDPDGNVDYRKTMRSALREIQLAEMYEVQAKSQAKRTELNDNRNIDVMRASISGSGNSDTDESVDISKMSHEDMVKAGLVSIDERNPPSFARTPMYQKKR